MDTDNLYYFKYYPEGDSEPASRNKRVELSFDSDTWEWYFTCQKAPLSEDYLMKMRAALLDGIAKVVLLEGNCYTEVREDPAMVISILTPDEN